MRHRHPSRAGAATAIGRRPAREQVLRPGSGFAFVRGAFGAREILLGAASAAVLSVVAYALLDNMEPASIARTGLPAAVSAQRESTPADASGFVQSYDAADGRPEAESSQPVAHGEPVRASSPFDAGGAARQAQDNTTEPAAVSSRDYAATQAASGADQGEVASGGGGQVAPSISGQQSNPQNAQIAGQALEVQAGSAAAKVPLAFLPLPPEVGAGNPQAGQVAQQLAQGFVDDIGGPNQNPNDPTYADRWSNAQEVSDQQYVAMFGAQAFLLKQQQINSNSNGK